MNKLTVKDWVCLVDDKALEAKVLARREQARRYDGGLMTPLTERLWRQIEICATADRVTFKLMNVDQEAAAGGYFSCGEACFSKVFTWDDLQDLEFIDSLLAREQVVVYRRALTMLTTLKARIVPLREALQAL